MNTAALNVIKAPYNSDEHDTQLILSIQKTFFEKVGTDNKNVVVMTNAKNLYTVFIENLDPIEKAGYNCNACRKFTNKYGALAVLTEDGKKVAACWDVSAVPKKFKKAVSAVKATVEKAQITSVFFSDKKIWGRPLTGKWAHFHIIPHSNFASRSLLKTSHQASAEKKKDYILLSGAICEFNLQAVKQAYANLNNNSFYRYERSLGIAEWFLDLLKKIDVDKKNRNNLIWYAVATAPAGFCHIKNTVFGTLLEDLCDGVPFNTIAERFVSKMNPHQYQRPTAPVSDNQLNVAEQIVEKLGIAKSLYRRYATLKDIQKIWEPMPVSREEPAGVFGHLRDTEKSVQESIAPPVLITWEKFRKTVLDKASAMQVYVNTSDAFYTFVTAEHDDSPPIIQWDNPVTWYTSEDNNAKRWGLCPNTFVEVKAVSLFPFMWDDEDKYSYQGKRVLFILNGCKPPSSNQGGGLFLEHLISDLHQVRAVIEKHSLNSEIKGLDGAEVSGIGFGVLDWTVTVKVASDGLSTRYKIDRWD